MKTHLITNEYPNKIIAKLYWLKLNYVWQAQLWRNEIRQHYLSSFSNNGENRLPLRSQQSNSKIFTHFCLIKSKTHGIYTWLIYLASSTIWDIGYGERDLSRVNTGWYRGGDKKVTLLINKMKIYLTFFM